MKRKSKKRIFGDERGLMFLCKDARRRWMQYANNRKPRPEKCVQCNKREARECDHIIPLGPRPRTFLDFSQWVYRMFSGQCQWLCKQCHDKKRGIEVDESSFKTTMWRCLKCSSLKMSVEEAFNCNHKKETQ